ncbi:PAS domain S-box-containing protein [Pseudomonas duriflava]|uniref:histidine kinase n=1 Tax=Pseudomonas duriflava TaxID=459528 RepID=A0A562Q6Z1_9PSED|nr:PAS domain S-box protein [Pseudomonas duriflava]TWI52493.1 PAS domain S-box-containing protein [Pseudomonas duriflava]
MEHSSDFLPSSPERLINRAEETALLSALLAQATDYAVICTDLEGRITCWSEGAQRILGWSAAEIMGGPVEVLFSSEDLAQGCPATQRQIALEQGRTQHAQWYLRKGGETFWGRGELIPLNGSTGEATGLIMILQDRSEEKWISERDNAGFLLRVIESSNECIKILDPSARLRYMSEAGQRLMGIVDFNRVLNCNWPDFWSGQDHAEVLSAIKTAQAGGIGRFTGFAPTFTGEARWWDVQVTSIQGPDGKPGWLLAISRDITELYQTSEALRASEQRFRMAIQAVQGILWTANARGEVVEDSPGWTSLTGQSFEDAKGFGWVKAFHPEDLPMVMQNWMEAVAERKRYTQECRILGQDGQWHLISTQALPVVNGDGSVREWVGVHTDLSGYQAAQEALRQETRRLEIINRIGARLAAELDLEKLVQEATDAAVALIGAQLGAFFYNVINEQGESYMLYALSGVPKEAFAKFPMPRNTAVFSPTFKGEGVVRSDDITQDPRYGKSDTHHGMPKEHLPVRSYLAIPVISRSGEVLGGLLFGHERVGVFTEEHEQLLTGIAGQAAIAIDNARLFQAAQYELAERKRAEEQVQMHNMRLRLLSEAIEKLPSAQSLEALMSIIGNATREISGADGVSIVLRENDECFYATEIASKPLWKGKRFPLEACISGWAMINRQTAIIADILNDSRIDRELYYPTSVRSLVMVPLISEKEGIAAIGAYWSREYTPVPSEIATLEALARSAGAVLKRLEADQALRTLNETLEQQVAERTAERDRIWKLSTDIMLVARFDTIVTAVNPAWTMLLGWSKSEIIGQSCMNFVHPDDKQITSAEIVRLSQGMPSMRFENRYRHKDGSYRWIAWAAAPSDQFLHAVGRDITAEKEQAEALRRTEEALRQAQKMEAVGQLTGGIAHDFNNLLTGIIGSLEMMQARITQGRTDTLERYAKVAMTSAQRAAALTHRLLAFARRQPLDPKSVDVNRLIVSMEDLLRRTLGESIRMEFVTDPNVWVTLCDPHQLESSILNLAINARDAMPEGGCLTIETRNTRLDQAYATLNRSVTPGDYICIAVTDTGAGMSHDVIKRAFDPFFTTKPMGQGTGMGLSMVYGFSRQSRGHATIYSEVGQGTTIKLYLPRFLGEAEEEAEGAVLTEAHRTDTGETVLVVEDEPAVRDLIVEVLKDLGYRPLEAATGPEGLEVLLSDQAIDLLVTDVGLPGLNGRQVADFAREKRPELKVLFITGYAENATLASGFLDPGMEMITKPFPVEVLATRVRTMIERGKKSC